jgi:plasmid stabilization system protein ParE
VRRATLIPSAKADLLNIFTYIATRSQSVQVAQRFDRKLRDYCHHLASLPFEMGKLRPELRKDMRSSYFEGYVIFFRYHRARFEVVNIIEGHRDMLGYFSETKPE